MFHVKKNVGLIKTKIVYFFRNIYIYGEPSNWEQINIKKQILNRKVGIYIFIVHKFSLNCRKGIYIKTAPASESNSHQDQLILVHVGHHMASNDNLELWGRWLVSLMTTTSYIVVDGIYKN